MRRNDGAFRFNVIALLGGMSMFLSAVEFLFPKPVPFMRLGLANLPLLLGLEILSPSSYALLVALKVLGQALVNGTLASYVFLFSFFGSALSAAVMFLCHRFLKGRISMIGISLMGALSSNAIQITLSILFIFGKSAWRILPLFLGLGLVAGLLMGVFAQRFAEASRWWKELKGGLRDGADGEGGEPEASRHPDGAGASGPGFAEAVPEPGRGVAPGDGVTSVAGDPRGAAGLQETATEPLTVKRGRGAKARPRKKRPDRIASFLGPVPRFWTGLALIPAFILVGSVPAKLALIALFALLVVLSGKRIRPGYYAVLVASICFFNLLIPAGKILFTLGPLKITETALLTGLMKGLTLCGLMFVSLFSVAGNLTLPGRLGGLLARTFYYFEIILEGRMRISPRRFSASLEEVLRSLFPPAALREGTGNVESPLDDAESAVGGPGGGAGKPARPASAAYCAFLVAAVWAPFVVGLLNK